MEVTVDIAKIRPGDKVTLVPLEVEWINTSIKKIGVEDAEGTISCFALDQITAHHPAPREIGVGDRVRTQSGRYGTVMRVEGGVMRVLLEEGPYNYHEQHLTIVEGDQ